jgi:hypothetical protein
VGPVASLRKRGGERKGAPATHQDICPALLDLCHTRYLSLFRLTALLMTGEADAWHGSSRRPLPGRGSLDRLRLSAI